MKNPLRAELANIFDVDLRQTAVTPAGVVSVIGRPIRSGRAQQQKRRLNVNKTRNRKIMILLCSRPCDETGESDYQRCQLARVLHTVTDPSLPARFEPRRESLDQFPADLSGGGKLALPKAAPGLPDVNSRGQAGLPVAEG